MGSALDVLLFQIAVAAHESHGLERAKEQIARNITIVLAVIAPACAGVLLTLPSLEALVVPAEFRGPFGHYLTLMMPGLFALTLINFAVNPIFQIEKKTMPLIGAALIGCAATPVLVYFLPRGGDASSLAVAQSVAYIAALFALTAFATASRPRWPSLSDLLRIAAALVAMIAVLLPMRGWTPGYLALATQIVVGAAVYALAALALDVGGLRTPVVEKIRGLVGRAPSTQAPQQR